MPWDDSGDYIRSGHREPGDTCRTIVISGDQGIKAIYCRYGDEWDVQSFLFDKKKWNMTRAKDWFSKHQQDSFEAERHPDFQRILDEFAKYYGSREKGESEYYDWIDELGIDETKPYGHSFESFRFAKDKISLWREDEENKHYKVLVGFPLQSMNGNVYTEDELKAAAKTLVGIQPNLNHWDDVPLTGCKFIESAYEDGANEAILKVPKDLICPECGKDKHFHEYIDEKHIVNVSLECSCGVRGKDGSCGGMKYTGCALLTKDTLPGIPLARIFPLEAIMREALTRGHHKKEKKKLVVKVVGLSKEAQLDPADPNKPLDKNPVKPDGHFQCPDGMIYSPTQGKCVPSKECPPGQAWDENLGKCMPIAEAPPEGTDVMTGGQAAGDTSHKPLEYVKGVDYVEDKQGEREFNPSADWPDSCFGYVPPEAKGADGVKSARKLPYKWPDGEISFPNVRNALARLDQTQGIPDAEKERIRKMFQAIMSRENPDYQPSGEVKQDLENAELRLSNYRLAADKFTLEGKVTYYEAELAKNIDVISTQKGEMKALREQVNRLENQDRERAERAADAEKRFLERSKQLEAEHQAKSKKVEAELEAAVREHKERVKQFEQESAKIDAERSNERKKHAEELAEARLSAKEALESRDAYKAGQEAFKVQLEKENNLNQKLMAENLGQTISLTAAHEETLNLSKEKYDIEEKLKKAKRISKAVVTM